MLLYNMQHSYSPALVELGAESMIPVFHNQFAFMHLITTMFLVDVENRLVGGGCVQLLRPLGLDHLLSPIADILNRSVGSTTFGDYLRISRNKLAVHGNLTFSTLPPAVQQVTFNEYALDQYRQAGEDFEHALRILRDELRTILDVANGAVCESA